MSINIYFRCYLWQKRNRRGMYNPKALRPGSSQPGFLTSVENPTLIFPVFSSRGGGSIVAQATFAVNDSGAVSRTFTLASTDKRDASYLALALGTAELPVSIAVKHSESGQGDKASDRHLIQFSRKRKNAETLISNDLVVNLTVSRPRLAEVTDTDVKDAVYFVKNFLSDTNIALLFNSGITP